MRDAESLAHAAEQFRARLTGEAACPDCGDPGPHADNMGMGDEQVFCCEECGTLFGCTRSEK